MLSLSAPCTFRSCGASPQALMQEQLKQQLHDLEPADVMGGPANRGRPSMNVAGSQVNPQPLSLPKPAPSRTGATPPWSITKQRTLLLATGRQHVPGSDPPSPQSTHPHSFIPCLPPPVRPRHYPSALPSVRPRSGPH